MYSHYKIDSCEALSQAIKECHALTSGHYPGNPLDATVLPGLNSMGFWNATRAQDWGHELHRNEGIEIVYLLSATGEY